MVQQGLTARGVMTTPVVASMREAVEQAVNGAKPGDTVLLSPGLASFGLFRNEFDRGAQFRQAVRGLAAEDQQ
jgi:UDP-N-acetylmuramoylalanine--D-glutamate ligase